MRRCLSPPLVLSSLLVLASSCARTQTPIIEGDIALTVVVETDRALADVTARVRVSIDGVVVFDGVPEGFYLMGAAVPPLTVESGTHLVVVSLHDSRGTELATDATNGTYTANATLRFSFRGGCLGGCPMGEVCVGGACRDECEIDPTRCGECACFSDSDCPSAECGAIECHSCACVPVPDDADCPSGEVCADGVCRPDESECDCLAPEPCMGPPPFGCAAVVRVRGECACEAGLGFCDGACDPRSLECVDDAAPLQVTLRTEYTRDEFDAVELRLDGVYLLETAPPAGDLIGGAEVGFFQVPANRDQTLMVRLRSCGRVVAEREVRLRIESDPSEVVVPIIR